MAGLPNRAFPLALTMLVLTMVSLLGSAQNVQTPPGVIEPVLDVQTDSTTLQQVTDIVGTNPAASDEEKAGLIDLLVTAVDQETLDMFLVEEMLAGVGWETLDEGIKEMISLIGETLAAYLDGAIEDPIAGLLDAYNATLTPDGIVNAITKAGASLETISQVQSLVASGIPPGIVLRVTKAGLRDESFDVTQILTDLGALYAEDPQTSPGQVANEATGNGSFKHQEQEENENGVDAESGPGPREYREEETNANDPAGDRGNGKSAEKTNPKDKEKKNG